MYLLRMPKADENMGEGTVARWLVREGDEVAERQDCCECVADKGEFLVWAEERGVVRKVYAPEQSVVPVAYVLAAIGGAEEPLPDVEAENERLIARSREELTARDGLSVERGARVRATPAARRVARELGVALADVAASSSGALVREEDVRAFAAHGDGEGAGE
ncbi:MAG: biotin/lipoyl-containing protein [Planctomycetota bacterium]|jgi:pyruvate dehydrogenase E2 component (dihydrolipoamide acetyltransferase)